MLMSAVILNMVSALGLIAMGAKFYFGPAPAGYHLKVMGVSRGDLSAQQTTVFSAIYRVMGASFFALATALASLSWFAVSADFLWAKLTVLGAGLALGLPAFGITYAIHKMSGVQTPWKPAIIINASLILAFVLSVL